MHQLLKHFVSTLLCTHDILRERPIHHRMSICREVKGSFAFFGRLLDILCPKLFFSKRNRQLDGEETQNYVDVLSLSKKFDAD